MMTIWDKLAIPFSPQQVSWRVGGGKKQLAYITSRDVMDRLDKVVGPENWQDDFVTEANGRVMCRLSIRVNGEWITKCDAAGETKVESEKGAFSDAFKRAAVKFGMGRDLYHIKGANIAQLPPWYIEKYQLAVQRLKAEQAKKHAVENELVQQEESK